MLYNDFIGYMSDKLDIKMFLLEDLCEERPDERLEKLELELKNNLWKRTRFNETSLKNELYYEEIWYHPRIDKEVEFAVPVFRFKERNYFARKKYKVMSPKYGAIHNFDILLDKTTSRILFSKRGYHLMNINTKYQLYKIYSFEKYHGHYKPHYDFKYTRLTAQECFHENAFHYMVASYKGGDYLGLEEPEQIRTVNYFPHPTRGEIELGKDVEVKRKPKDFTKRMPTDYEKYPQFKPRIVYVSPKEFLKDYWDCPEKASGLFQRLIEYYHKHIKPLEEQAAFQKALEEAIEKATKD